jgi:hypothetical protein
MTPPETLCGLWRVITLSLDQLIEAERLRVGALYKV